MAHITDIILKKLADIEKNENVKIIYCAEAGSRAWGFASPDSDYDVRFIYVRPREYYLSLNEGRDVIEWQLDDTLDINGWDIKKALILLHSSNPTLFEWSNSPIVYKTTEEWESIQSLLNGYFRPSTAIHHYLGIAKKNKRIYLKDDDVRLKKYFYVIRPILACYWIISEKCPPPVLFSSLLKECTDAGVLFAIDELVRIKTSTPELGEGKRIPTIDEYIEKSICELEKISATYSKESIRSWDELNEAFLRLL